MVMPVASAELCPQCGADVRAAGARCSSCGFWLPAAPAPRTGPPMARPVPSKDTGQATTRLLLSGGAVVVLALIGVAAVVGLRKPETSTVAAPAISVPAAPASAAGAVRPEPSRLLAEARREASAWHADAVLVSLTASPLDTGGVASEGTVQLTYARPAGPRISGGAETSSEQLVLRGKGGAALARTEERAGKAQLAPEPNCLFEDAWAAAQRAGADGSAGLQLRYQWSDHHGRPVWELLSAGGQVLRRLDGGSCSILTR